MPKWRAATARPLVGVAYAAYVPELLRRHRELVDYVEIPFERLRHDPGASQIIEEAPTVLHCASLSVAGMVPASDQLLRDIKHWTLRTATPWIGEHLAFVTAPGLHDGVVDVGYTVAPPLNDSSLKRVASACAHYQRELRSQIILENPPQYFVAPGSTMSQTEFICALCEQTDIRLLFDISHFLITSWNAGVDPTAAMCALPLQKVQEVHLSGVRQETGTFWDDHGVAAPKEVFALLRILLGRSSPKAITLEYNWSALFPETLLVADINRVRHILAQTGHS
jgi:uncharacterized protein (UPF0276 family)